MKPLELKPYLTIWTKPRSTFETFFKEHSGRSIYGLPFLVYGISMGLDLGPEIYLLFDENPDPQYKLLTYVLTSGIGIGATYLILGILHPWIMNVVGKIWKGEASRSELANVVSLSTIPYCAILIYQLVVMAFGIEPTLDNVNAGFQYVIWVVSFSFLVIGVSTTQKFSYGFSLINILLAILPLVILGLMIRG